MTRRGIEIVGAPFDLCGLRLGSRLGPDALRLAGLAPALRELGLDVHDRGDAPVRLEETDAPGLRDFASLFETLAALKTEVASALAGDRTALVLGGEHTLSAASVGAALEATGGDLAVLWIDAHADVNTPGSSDTGNVHGMPLAALAGIPAGSDDRAETRQWREMVDLVKGPGLDLRSAVWLGLRDVDAAERPHLTGLPLTMHDVDRHGIEACAHRVFEHLEAKRRRNLWISFDVDSLDPILAPGTGTAVRGGLSYREAHLLAELLHEGLQSREIRLVGVDVMETNPIFDHLNATAIMAVEWVASLFGKCILGPCP